MACWEGKKYKLDKSTNFEEYMKELGELQNQTHIPYGFSNFFFYHLQMYIFFYPARFLTSFDS